MQSTSGERHPPDTEILVGRMVDRECGSEDEARFRTIADDRPELWRDLAERLLDMAALGEQFQEEAAAALDVDLPRRRGAGRPGPWMFSLVGWAALLIVALSWVAVSVRGPATDAGRVPVPAEEEAFGGWTPDDHYRAYLEAPNVISELEPTVLEVIELPDDRLEITYLRRIQETAVIRSDLEADVVTRDRRLAVPPSSLRGTVIERPRMD